jgi:hypothetical protein
MSHLCFYSERDPLSKIFLEQIATTPFSKEFRFICVDKPKPGEAPRAPLPSYVKVAPTLMIQGESEPRTDGNVMNWLSERRMKASAASAASSSRSSSGGGGAAASLDGPMAFIGGDAFDDGLAFIGEDTGTTNRLTGSMASLNDLSALAVPDSRTIPGNIMAATAGGGAAPQSAKAKAMEDALERYRAARDIDVKGAIQRR